MCAIYCLPYLQAHFLTHQLRSQSVLSNIERANACTVVVVIVIFVVVVVLVLVVLVLVVLVLVFVTQSYNLCSTTTCVNQKVA